MFHFVLQIVPRLKSSTEQNVSAINGCSMNGNTEHGVNCDSP